MTSPRHQDPNQNRPGYKKTKVGWIPEEWDAPLLSVLTVAKKPIVYGIVQAGPHVEGGVPYIRSTDVGNRFVSSHSLLCTTPEIAERYKRSTVEPGDIVFSLRGNIGETSLVPVSLAGSNLTQGTARIAVTKFTESIFIHYSLKTHGVRRLVDAWAKGSTFREITIEDLRKVPIPLPSPPEQKKIAKILSTWDEAIEQTRKLIEARKRRKQGLMQQLLTGHKRLPGFRGKWRNIQLGKLFKPVRRPLEWDDEHFYSLLSVRRRSGGVFLRERLQGCKIQTKVMFEAHAGDFLISKMQVLHGATGLVPKELDGTHISGSYIALRPINDDQIDPDFFARLSSTPEFYHLSYLSSYGVHIEKMTFNLRWFLREKVSIPENIEEQQAIAAVLQTADEEVANLEAQLAALESQKRGLMQKLLTGTVRVKF
jgi:type I restriction enzyme S subunit